jgi:heterodisulfide reductase subunit C
MLRRKLDDVREQGVDALVVSCPSCFLQFDLNQAALLRESDASRASAEAAATGEASAPGSPGNPGDGSRPAGPAGVPVFYITELIALALGHEPAELGVDMHRVSAAPFLEKWAAKLEQRAELAKDFNLGELQICAGCRACDADCPVSHAEEDFVPSTVITSLLAGGLEAVLDGPNPWRCTDCMTCFERCHSRIGMAQVFEQLKRLARERGRVPAAVQSSYQAFLKDGALGTGRASAREKLGLPAQPENGIVELKAVLATPESAE